MADYDSFPEGIQRPPYSGYDSSVYRPVKRTEYEGNIVAIRPRASGVTHRRSYTLAWSSLPDDQFTLLEDFFATHSGLPFHYTTPFGETRLVTFSSDTLTASCVSWGANGRKARWSVKVKLEEISPNELV